MNTATKLATYALALAAVFGGGWRLGTAVGTLADHVPAASDRQSRLDAFPPGYVSDDGDLQNRPLPMARTSDAPATTDGQDVVSTTGATGWYRPGVVGGGRARRTGDPTTSSPWSSTPPSGRRVPPSSSATPPPDGSPPSGTPAPTCGASLWGSLTCAAAALVSGLGW